MEIVLEKISVTLDKIVAGRTWDRLSRMCMVEESALNIPRRSLKHVHIFLQSFGGAKYHYMVDLLLKLLCYHQSYQVFFDDSLQSPDYLIQGLLHVMSDRRWPVAGLNHISI